LTFPLKRLLQITKHIYLVYTADNMLLTTQKILKTAVSVRPQRFVVIKQQQHLQTQNQIRCKSSPAADVTESIRVSNAGSSGGNSNIVKGSNTATELSSSTTSSSVPIFQSLLAATAGIVTVSMAAVLVENTTASTVPEYDPAGQRFDQSTFMGRFSKMLLACDPRLLLYSEGSVRESQIMLQNYQDYLTRTADAAESERNTMNRALWEAQRIVTGALNDSGEWVPRPFRMSGYVPYNGPICVAMVASQSTIPLLFWSWVNQSQNALVNYYNRNAASELTNETMMKSYSVAVGSALTVAFGLATLIQRRYEPSKAKMLLRYVAFPSSVAASSLNCYIVRSPEITTGIPLMNSRGEIVGNNENDTSQIAAAQGVYLTTASRAILQAPVFFVPPFLLGFVPMIRQYLVKYPKYTVPVSTYILLVAFGCGLPATVAIFPQISEIDASAVEEKFQHLRDPVSNRPYEKFYYDKGL
jgi:sideroflexin-5